MKIRCLRLKEFGFDIGFLKLVGLTFFCLFFRLFLEFLTPFIDLFLIMSAFFMTMVFFAFLFFYLISYLANQENFMIRLMAVIISSLPFLLFFLGSSILYQTKLSGFRFYIFLNSSVYSEIINIENQKAEYDKKRDFIRRDRFNNVFYRIDRSDVVRIAFPIGGGIGDNWSGIIYDPTGKVEYANLDYTPELKKLFGGDLVSCGKIEENYFHCGFT